MGPIPQGCLRWELGMELRNVQLRLPRLQAAPRGY